MKNSGTVPINGWSAQWTLASGQAISQAWGGTLTSTGSNVTISNLSYNGALATGTSTTAGFLASWTSTNTLPASVTCVAS